MWNGLVPYPHVADNIKIKSFSEKKKLKEYITTKPALCEMLKKKIKNMNNEMATNTYLSKIESKNK